MIFDVLLMMSVGTFLGFIYSDNVLSDWARILLMQSLGLSLTIALASMRVFGGELRVIFWREAAPGSGMELSTKAYFIAKNLVEIPRICLLTFFFVTSFYLRVKPMCHFPVATPLPCRRSPPPSSHHISVSSSFHPPIIISRDQGL